MGELATRLLKSRVIRFGLAGALNTITNFTVLNVLFYVAHQNKFLSEVIATACAIVVSFLLNRSFVFSDKAQPIKKFIKFVALSVIGVLLIQNAFYVLALMLLQGHETPIIQLANGLFHARPSRSFVDINLSNLFASLMVMFWNYHGYKLVVFNGRWRPSESIDPLVAETA